MFKCCNWVFHVRTKFYGNLFFFKFQPNKQDLHIEHVNITNLTAEIESFVRNTGQAEIDSKSTTQITLTTDDSKYIDKNDLKEKQRKQTILRESPENNDFYSQDDDITIEKIQNLGIKDVKGNERIPVKRAPTDEEPTNDASELTKKSQNVIFDFKDNARENIIVESKCAVKQSNNEESTQIYDEKGESVESKATRDTEGTTTPTSSAVEFILENENETDATEKTSLKMTESIDDLTKVEKDSFDTNAITSNTKLKQKLDCECVSVNESSNTFSRYDVRFIPLKLDSPKIRKKDIVLKKEPPTPPQRRRSVKDIIESINKCQSLLKINQGTKAEKDKINKATYSSSSKSFDSKSSKMSDIAEVNNNVKTEEMSNIPLFVEKFNEFSNNFEHSNNANGKVEWNPVPKPRRHRNSTQGSIN